MSGEPVDATTLLLKAGGLQLSARCHPLESGVLELRLQLAGATCPCLLHWGLQESPRSPWRAPQPEAYPPQTTPFDEHAVRSAFNERGELTLHLGQAAAARYLSCVLYLPEQDRWLKNGRDDARLRLHFGDDPRDALAHAAEGSTTLQETCYSLDGGTLLALRLLRDDHAQHRLLLATDEPAPLALHWGVARRGRGWELPPPAMRPAGSETLLTALDTPFVDHVAQNLRRLELLIDHRADLQRLYFVLRAGSGRQERWLKNRGRDFMVALVEPTEADELPDAAQLELVKTIAEHENERGSWTLMHRFQLCYELLEQAGHDLSAFAYIYVWLRFSALRQLDWQRRYNTKPRELAHAQDRLTQQLAQLYARVPVTRELARLCLGTLGRGADGQRVRDEILEIMHRHRIKEVTGHFLEEWHQKLHNNTTPDDVAICQAYLSFLHSNGDQRAFDDELARHGVDRARLASYERPIVSAPDFAPQLKEGLLRDFGAYLLTLKRVHEGSDLTVALEAVRGSLPDDLGRRLEEISRTRAATGDALPALCRRIATARRDLAPLLTEGHGDRDLLFVDLALAETLRRAIERDAGMERPLPELFELLAATLTSLVASTADEELQHASTHLDRQLARDAKTATTKREWALQTHAVLERVARALGGIVDRFFSLLQPRAEHLGEALDIERWVRSLFTEEVLRGQPPFALAAVLKRLEPKLRAEAALGDWQVVSRASGRGVLEVASTLREVQGRELFEPTIFVVERVAGDEEIPPGVVAVLTNDSTDLVSHVAVRARNAHVLFATCHRPALLDELRARAGAILHVDVDAAGNVRIDEREQERYDTTQPFEPIRRVKTLEVPLPPPFTRWVLGSARFAEGLVGGKSLHLQELRGQLPGWIQLPEAIALPFGAFEQVLRLSENSEAAARYEKLVEGLDRRELARGLAELHELVLGLVAPPELRDQLEQACKAAGLPWPADYRRSWQCIKEVWASKWSERATLSRDTHGLPHDRLAMAVLVQQVVPADYAFVLHTVNPLDGDRSLLYGEVVAGLGETLVGNYPGRALGFLARKDGATPPEIVAYPSKSSALRGGGLIFRSDSSGEDRADFAGAGLYESVLHTPPTSTLVDYTREPLINDEAFRNALLSKLVSIGRLVEEAQGCPQDIEGAICGPRYHVVQARAQVGL